MGSRASMAGLICRGEIRWYKFSKPDKKRPVLVLTRATHIEYLKTVTVAPITSAIREVPSQVHLSIEDGLQNDCVVNLDHLRTVEKSHLGSLIATLSNDRLVEIKIAILYALGF